MSKSLELSRKLRSMVDSSDAVLMDYREADEMLDGLSEGRYHVVFSPEAESPSDAASMHLARHAKLAGNTK